MPRGGGEFTPGDEPVAGIDCVNGVILWPNGNPIGGRRQNRQPASHLYPAFGDAALVKLMSLEAEADALRSFEAMAELMEEAPGV